MDRPIIALQTLDCDRSVLKLEVNSQSSRTDQIFRIDFHAFIITSVKYHLKLFSAKFLLPIISLKWTLFNYLLSDATRLPECCCYVLLGITLLTVQLVYFFATLPGSSGGLVGDGWGELGNSSAASGSSDTVGMVWELLFLFCLYFFVPALPISMLTPLFLLAYSVYLCYFFLAVPMSSVRKKTYAWVPHYLQQYWIVLSFWFGLIFAFQKLNYNNNRNTAYSFYFNCSSEQ